MAGRYEQHQPQRPRIDLDQRHLRGQQPERHGRERCSEQQQHAHPSAGHGDVDALCYGHSLGLWHVHRAHGHTGRDWHHPAHIDDRACLRGRWQDLLRSLLLRDQRRQGDNGLQHVSQNPGRRPSIGEYHGEFIKIRGWHNNACDVVRCQRHGHDSGHADLLDGGRALPRGGRGRARGQHLPHHLLLQCFSCCELERWDGLC